MTSKWEKLLCQKSELQLLGTLNGGQSFRWKKKSDAEWIGVFDNKVWTLQQTDDSILYQVHGSDDENYRPEIKKSKTDYGTLLSKYFRLDRCIQDYYKEWSSKDPYFKVAAEQFYGIRILGQDVTENLFSFICSSNNNIKRISSMVEKLATFYGKKICEIDGQMYYGFPEVDALAGPGVEDKLRKNGFGYRASYISKSAQMIVENGGKDWIEKLKRMDYESAKKSLMMLTGIGAKVADCICLMSLGHLEAIPVDTHIFQIAARLYMPHLKIQKTVTDKVYKAIGDHFRELYGPLAGWAHTVLFCADLKKFQPDGDGKHRGEEKRRKK